MRIHRRLLLSAPVLALLPRKAMAQAALGTTRSLTGQGVLTRAGQAVPLQPDVLLQEGDMVATLAASIAQLELFTATKVTLGPETRFGIDRFAADLGGVVTIGGAMVFDRPDDLPKLDLTVQSAFAQIGVRGTRFFAGPSKGVYGIFVARGAVEVRAGGQTRQLAAGEGVDIPSPGAAPGPVGRWKPRRITEAFASFGLTP